MAKPSPTLAFRSECHASMFARTESPHRPTSLKVCEGMWLMWLAPGMRWPRNSAHGLRGRGFRRRLGCVHVPVARSRMMRIAREQAFEHLVNAPDVGRIEVLQTRPPPWRRAQARLEVKQGVGVERAMSRSSGKVSYTVAIASA